MPESNTPTEPCPPEFQGEIDLRADVAMKLDPGFIRSLVSNILTDAGYHQGAISILVTSDREIHELNRRYLEHDYATDVLSFVLQANPEAGWMEGEVIVSAETAEAAAREFGWSSERELTLYLIHGTLHLVGYDDKEVDSRQAMRRAEDRYLHQLGWQRSHDRFAGGERFS